jgi:hypothetical protein
MSTLLRFVGLSLAATLAMGGCNFDDDTPNSQPNNQFCLSEDPSKVADGCATDADCSAAQRCLPTPGACRPSSCACDAATGTWRCVANCGQVLSCQTPDTIACQGPDPSLDACSPEAGCADGSMCVPRSDEACRPSSCNCDAATGQWICTKDCGQYHECRPLVPKQCQGPDPSQDGCSTDADCGVGEVCATSAAAVCRPSACMCDAATGQWICTKDCNPYHACQPAPAMCQGPDPSQTKCENDAQCQPGESCQPDGDTACRPSSCKCDATTGQWICTNDCLTYNTCAPIKNQCMGANPAEQGCDSDAECGRGKVCVVSDAQVCVPSSCQCDAMTGAWICTRDCGPLRQCADAPSCAGSNPSVNECATSRDCAAGQSCQLVRGCRPSACSCDAVTGQWLCTADCNPRYACI